MRRLFKIPLIFLVWFVASTELSAQNMNSYITLTVAKGAKIRFSLRADTDGTPVKVISGNKKRSVKVGTDRTDCLSYTAGDTTMTIYGDITEVICRGNYENITAIDASNNIRLKALGCENNQLTNLDVCRNIQLQWLVCSFNPLESLDVSGNTNLLGLYCENNQLTSLDVSGNVQLKELYCNDNQLTNLDVSCNTNLHNLRCENNQLTSLDVSGNMQLEELYCSNNNFTIQALNDIYCSLPDKVDKDERSGYIYPVYNASSLNYDTVIASNKLIATNKDWIVGFSADKYREIPSTTGSYMCSSADVDVSMSHYITLTVVKGAAIRLDLRADTANTGVKIVSGKIEQTIAVGNDWTGVHKYTADDTIMTIYGNVTRIDCRENGKNLTALDVRNNVRLEGLWCHKNELTNLDVSRNKQLVVLNCDRNKLTSLDVSHNAKLETLLCYNNNLTNLDVSGDMQLKELRCNNNQLTDLDVSRNKQLVVLYCDGNKLTSLDVNYNTQLATLHCNNNQLKKLYVGGGMQLKELYCSNNQLENLNLKDNMQLEKLYCIGNQLTNIDVSGDMQLKELHCSNNQLEDLNLKDNTQLKKLYCNDNRLISLDVSCNKQLGTLWCYNNNLTNLDVSGDIQLETLYCNDNQLTNLDVSGNTNLTELRCYNNNFTILSIDDLYCSLPNRNDKKRGYIYPLKEIASSDRNIVLATNKNNATSKNWSVLYYENGDVTLTTTGSYVCPNTDMIQSKMSKKVK